MDFELLMLCRKVKAPPLEMALLKELAIFFNPTTKQCNPTGEQLSEVTRFSEASVWRGLESLKKMGFISSDNPKTRGKGNFSFNIDSLTMSANSLTIREPKKNELSHHDKKLSHGEINSRTVREKLSHHETQRSNEDINKNKEEVRAQAPNPPAEEKMEGSSQGFPDNSQGKLVGSSHDQAGPHIGTNANSLKHNDSNPQSTSKEPISAPMEPAAAFALSSNDLHHKTSAGPTVDQKAKTKLSLAEQAQQASSLPPPEKWPEQIKQIWIEEWRGYRESMLASSKKNTWNLFSANACQRMFSDALARKYPDDIIGAIRKTMADGKYLTPLFDPLPLKGAVNGRASPKTNGGDYASAEANKDNMPKYNPNLNYNLKI